MFSIFTCFYVINNYYNYINLHLLVELLFEFTACGVFSLNITCTVCIWQQFGPRHFLPKYRSMLRTKAPLTAKSGSFVNGCPFLVEWICPYGTQKNFIRTLFFLFSRDDAEKVEGMIETKCRLLKEQLERYVELKSPSQSMLDFTWILEPFFLRGVEDVHHTCLQM